MQTFNEFAETVIENAFPEDIASNLLPIYKKRVQDGLIDLQRLVPGFKAHQFSLHQFGSTYYRQGMTVIAKPPGKVRRVMVFSSKRMNDVVFYDVCSREDVDRLIAQRSRNAKYPESPQLTFPYFAADASLDKGWRSERGLFCIDGKEILILPHIESVERIAVEYDGAKTLFEPDDPVDFEEYQSQVIDALVLHLKREAALREDRSTSDYVAVTSRWKEVTSWLMLDAKNNLEPELTAEDIGVLPRTMLPATTLPIKSLGCSFKDGPYFDVLWMYCKGDGLWYNFGALVIDDQVVVQNFGEGGKGGAPEATVEILRVDQLFSLANDNKYYAISAATQSGGPEVSVSSEGVDSDCKSGCSNFAVVALDVLGTDGKYYRITLESMITTEGQAPIVNIAPLPCENSEDEETVIEMRDQVTGGTMWVQIEDGSFVISDGSSTRPVSKIKLIDKVTGKPVYLRVEDGSTTVSDT